MSHSQTSFPDLAHAVSKQLAALRDGQPGTLQAFRDLSANALEAGSLSAKTKELLALALGIAAHCDDCIAFHTRALVALHATPAEVQETIAVAVYMGGGPSLMYGAHALAAYEQFADKAAEQGRA
jgi:AhpD family alkylhydroperoxidase